MRKYTWNKTSTTWSKHEILTTISKHTHPIYSLH